MKKLKRKLGLLDVYVICTGAMFSSGFFLLPGLAAAQAGPAVVLAYFLAGLLIVPSVVSTAELCTAMPRAGGGFLFVDRSLGPLAGTIGGLATWIALNLKVAFTLIGMGAYLSLLIELPIQWVAVGFSIIFALLNVVGVREAVGFQKILVLFLISILIFFIVQGATEILRAGFGEVHERQFVPFMPFGIHGTLSTVAFVFISYLGLTQVASLAGEVEHPSRNIPLAMFLSLGTTTLLYVLGIYVMVAALDAAALRADPAPVASAAREVMNWLPWKLGFFAVILAALAAFASTGNGGLMAAARLPVAMARSGAFPNAFVKIGRFHTPTRAVVLSTAVILLLIFFVPVEEVAKMGSATQLVLFILLNAAVIIFRQSGVRGYEPGFRSPLYPWTQIAGIGICAFLLYELGLKPLLFTVGLALFGALWYFFFVRKHVHRDAAVFHLRERRSGEQTSALEDELSAMADLRKEADAIGRAQQKPDGGRA